MGHLSSPEGQAVVRNRRDVRENGKLAAKTKRPIGAEDVFKVLDCRDVTYEFRLSRDSFDLESFYEAGRIARDERTSWAGPCAPKDRDTGYHIHFSGGAKQETVRLRVQYVKGSIKPRPGEMEPFAETFMAWLGTFILTPTTHSVVLATFEKPADKWMSRFGLPLKATLPGIDTEIAIDGISLVLPPNEFGANHGWLIRLPKQLTVNVRLERRVNPKKFNLREELLAINESIRIFVEEVTK